MGLTQITGSPFRIDAFITALRADAWSPGVATVIYDEQTNDLANKRSTFWYPRLNRFYSTARNDPSADDFLWWDPNLLDSSSPASGYVNNGAIVRSTIFCLGVWDQVANTQRIYGAINTGNSDLIELNSAGASFDLNQLAGGWPFHPAAAGLVASTGIASGTIGARFTGQGIMVIFEEWGYALHTDVSVRHTDGSAYARVLAKVDLSTGSSTIEQNFPISYDVTPHAFQNPTAFGNEFGFSYIQFVPDEDSTGAAPKGMLYFGTNDSDVNQNLRTGTNPGALTKVYVRFNDFNPTGKSAAPGTPNRVHGREVLFSRFEVIEQTEPESGGIGVNSTAFIHETVPHFHVPSQTIKLWYDTHVGGGNDSVHVQYSLAPGLDAISAPTARSLTETGRTVTFEVTASGDLGEPVAGISVDWTLKRGSTFEEILNTLAQDPTNTLANVPLDDDGLLEVRYLGTLLTITTDYTIVRSTGVITWAGAHSPPNTSGYTVTYAHRATAALTTPSHGSLLNSNSKTDTDGRAVARVKYADNEDLVGMIDDLDATQSAP